jgi:hypothetical protein
MFTHRRFTAARAQAVGMRYEWRLLGLLDAAQRALPLAISSFVSTVFGHLFCKLATCFRVWNVGHNAPKNEHL